ncbi:MAG: hypothetical protein K2M30_02595 [Desulfovibrionaceae bacterium]|nr:hypothetical protein [Desulfovibrionaceae bacterium]
MNKTKKSTKVEKKEELGNGTIMTKKETYKSNKTVDVMIVEASYGEIKY